MSNALAIATVTTALAQIVRTAALTTVQGADVITAPPEVNPPTDPRVRLFLYQVTPNGALRNRDLPNRSANGNLVGRPTVAFDLHYLLVFYGNENELEPQRMLGAVARDLYAKPVLMGQMISDAVASQPFLAGSNLAAAVDQVKVTQAPLTLDEISKLWSSFFQTPYALSIAYQATVVLIESDDAGPAGLPVLSRGSDDHGVDTLLGPFPLIEGIHIGEGDVDSVRLRRPSYLSARLGAVITIRGRNLGGDSVSVSFTPRRQGPVNTLPIAASDRSPTQIRVVLPKDAAAQTAWVSGTYDVTVVIVQGATRRRSTSLPVALAPQVSGIAPPNPIAGAGTTVTLTISCAPQVLPEQRAQLLLADREVAADVHPAATTTLRFEVVEAPAVNQALVRLRVDDVDSLPFAMPTGATPFAFDDAQKVTIA